MFRDPAYIALVKLGKERDLLYGVPELPEKMPKCFRDSAFSDNVSLMMLRSQTENRPIREQVQSVLHYGMHGWAHGHYDRNAPLSLMRYGCSFYNPEMAWVSARRRSATAQDLHDSRTGEKRLRAFSFDHRTV